MVTKSQYEAAQKKLRKAQIDQTRAMRKGDQKAVDKAGEVASQAFAVIAEYKAHHGR